jgi:uncharacterized membrane protein YoaK (UPF0700 family)
VNSINRPDEPTKPRRDSVLRTAAHGPLPGLLLLLTAVTGAVDAVSILRLGRVFVANMTGNVVFAGFAVVGAPGFALGPSLVALAGFLVGAAAGGWLAVRQGRDRSVLLLITLVAETSLVAVALVVAALGPGPAATGERYSLSVLLATTMGIQNAVARRLAVPDMTTTVLTMTLTGIAADLREGGWRHPALPRRFLAVAAMFGGAAVGAKLVLDHGVTAALLLVTVVLLLVTLGGLAATVRDHGGWRRPPGAGG